MDFEQKIRFRIMVEAYLEAIDFTESPEDGTFVDFSVEFREKAWDDVREFLDQAGWELIEGREEQAGHDFWLTRNGHGVGFWESGRGWTEEEGNRFTEISKGIGEAYIEIGDDGMYHQ